MKKILSVMMTAVLTATTVFAVAGCGSSVPNDEYTIEYQVYDGGYGMEWFERTSAKFKEQHPEVNFVKSKQPSVYGQAKTLLQGGPDATTIDLFMGSEYVMKFALYGSSFLSGYDCVLEDLTDVYNSKVINLTKVKILRNH